MTKVVNLFEFKAKKEESKENKDLDNQGDAWGRAIEPSDKTPTLPILDTAKYEQNKKRMIEEQKKHNEKVKKGYKIKP